MAGLLPWRGSCKEQERDQGHILVIVVHNQNGTSTEKTETSAMEQAGPEVTIGTYNTKWI
jgi:hypothetical protein